ncbi:MAG TPA: hypothetical protein VH370_27270 [Humisphaera sp.]|jgi:hypothetical protein|nr:hypothetical protein [Humisphaera sp.]
MSDGSPPPVAEPRWPVILAVLAVGGLYTALPSSLTIGPKWTQLAIAAALLIPSTITHARGNVWLNVILGHVIGVVLTLFMIWSLVLLIRALPAHKEPPVLLLRSAAALWITNILVFAQWYWRLDAGGPHQRDTREGHTEGAFLFPQMTLRDEGKRGAFWSPRFVDYLFLAFNTSTALSPTDVPVLSRWAKCMVMTLAIISLTVVVILVGRAVNLM